MGPTMSKEEFDFLKVGMDKMFDDVINSATEGEGKKMLDESVDQMIKLAGGGLDDKKVIRELCYTHMSHIVRFDRTIIGKLGSTNFIAITVSSMMTAYRLGQHNSELQSK